MKTFFFLCIRKKIKRIFDDELLQKYFKSLCNFDKMSLLNINISYITNKQGHYYLRKKIVKNTHFTKHPILKNKKVLHFVSAYEMQCYY